MIRLPIFSIQDLEEKDPEGVEDIEDLKKIKMYPLSISASRAKELSKNNEKFRVSACNHPVLMMIDKQIVAAILSRRNETFMILYENQLFLEKDIDQALEEAGYIFKKDTPSNTLYKRLYNIYW